MLAARFDTEIAAQAKERMKAGVKRNPPEILPEGRDITTPRDSRDIAGALAGVSGKTYEAGKRVAEQAAPWA